MTGALGTSALMAAFASIAVAPADPQSSRLAGLARVWGHVKYVHPALATSGIDWDAALVRAIPGVEGARTDGEYREAIASLLVALGDPVTRVLDGEPAAEVPDAGEASLRVRVETVGPGTAVLTVPNDPALESSPDLRDEICERFSEATELERLVVDLRSPYGRTPGWQLKNALVKCASRLLDGDVALPPARYLRHGFYMMQSVTGGAGGGLGPWDSGVEVVSSGSLRGEASRAPRLAFIVGGGTADVYPLLMALQAHGLAAVVQEGDVPAAGLMVKTFAVDEALSIAVRHGEWLRPDGGTGLQADAVVPEASGDAARQRALELVRAPRRAVAPKPVRSNFHYAAFVEKDYSETPYPDRAHRLLALFRLYNAIEYFFPYRDLMDRPWSQTLVDFVPRMLEAGDATDYALTVAELATRIQDSHVTLSSPVLDAYFGTHRPAVRVDLVEGLTLVTEVAPELGDSGLRVGDVVVSVDGEEASARRERLARYLPASTRGRLENKIDLHFLRGPPSRAASIVVQREDGAVRRASAPRMLEGLPPRSRPRSGPVHAVLSGGYGYVDLGRLEAAEVDAAFQTIRSTPAVILDMRGYPSSGARALVPRLARPGPRASAIYGTPRYEGSHGSFWLDEDDWPDPEGPPGERYAGRIAMLVDGGSQSAAEHICVLVDSVADVTFVGSRSSGADGGVTRTILPGGIVVNFTGQSVRRADGRQLQRVGIVPDVEAEPTLRGIRAGRDDVVERAVDFLDREM